MNRMERCMNYFRQCKAKAEELRIPFRWKLETVEGAAHQGVKWRKAQRHIFWEIIGRWKSESVSWELSAISYKLLAISH